ncbi:unnamed protein product [Zymoseptoria tritici ST99CH_1E4]|uniref:DUF7587 domain-containing protein n=1 Tax=Zymoseptoria tritici ST99CH_1E4 TaxID=1276532 RepID=A0A2H1GLR4_ZYMTR|nr:unnamed protein product [Zymoseptoria tritici ST99CH_1E4]
MQQATDELCAQLSDLEFIDSPGYLPFCPATSPRYQHIQLSPTPRFLFRVWSPNSDGQTDSIWIDSRDAAAKLGSAAEDLFQTSDVAATAAEIANHLWWRRGDRADNLVSWTSSLLFAIQYMIYRRRLESDGSDLDEIMLCILDTSDYPAGTFACDMDLIKAFYAESEDLQKLHRMRTGGIYYYGEYLSQGSIKIEGKCKIVSAQAMLDCGLASLWASFDPEFEGENRWAKAVVQIRQSLLCSETSSDDIDDEQADIAVRIAELFGSRWRLPMAVNLLALLPGQLQAASIGGILIGKGGYKDDDFRICALVNVQTSDEMPEVCRVQKIWLLIHELRSRRKTEELLREAISSVRRASMYVHGIADLTDEDRSKWLELVQQVQFMSLSLEQSIGEVPRVEQWRM